jgi:hypothetical protein
MEGNRQKKQAARDKSHVPHRTRTARRQEKEMIPDIHVRQADDEELF